MKKLLLITLALSLPLAQWAQADNDQKKRQRPDRDEPRAQPARPGNQNAQPVNRNARPVNRTTRPAVRQPTRQLQRNNVPTRQTGPRLSRTTSAAQNRTAVRTEAQNRARIQAANRANERNRQVNRNRNHSGQRDQANRGHRNYNRNSFNLARNRVIRTRHDRNWWRNHYNTTYVLFGGGYYYWWDNYWYPAYGYSPIYNNYIYNEPIYGYNNLTPGEVIQNVQLALRDEGYYPGAIDGLMGPQTRAALAAYQSDHRLIVTQAVDEPTLVTLGLS